MLILKENLFETEKCAYDEVFLEGMQTTFAYMMLVGTEILKFGIQEFYEIFLKSYYNDKCFITGLFGIHERSGTEIAVEISGFSYEKQNEFITYIRSDDNPRADFPKSDFYKCCFCFIYFQWRTCRTFNEINAVISFADFFELFKIHKDLSQDDFWKLIEKRFPTVP